MSTNAPLIRSPWIRRLSRAGRALARWAKAFARAVLAAARGFWWWSRTPLGRAVWLAVLFGALIGGLGLADRHLRVESDAAGDAAGADGADAAPDPVLARIAGTDIRLSEVRRFARVEGLLAPEESLTPAAAIEREILDRFIEQRLFARAAIADGLADDPAVRADLADARRRILAARYYERRIAAATSEAAVQDLYERQRSLADLGDEVKASYIVVATEEEAKAVIAAVEAGRPFAELARESSRDDATARLGGQLGWFVHDAMAPALAEAAFATKPGEMSAPFKTEFGWNVVLVEARRRKAPPSLEELRPTIERFLELQEVNRIVEELGERFYVERVGE